MRARGVKHLYLASSPVDYLDFDWGLEAHIRMLCADLSNGTYRPEPAEYIRGAKAKGLTRPFAFLAPRDSIVYVALVGLAQVDLLKFMFPKWTGWGQRDLRREDDGDDFDDSGWFRAWLRRSRCFGLSQNTIPLSSKLTSQ